MARTAVTDSAASDALACGLSHRFVVRWPYQSLQLFTARDLGEIGGSLRADYGKNDRIVVLYRVQQERRVWFHALLHGIFGLPGTTLRNHPKVFADCGILVI